MQLNLKNFLNVPQINILPTASPRGESEKSVFVNVLQKDIKTLDDAMIIYEQIRSFPCFDTFFAQNLKNLDMNNILNLCRSFKYESIEADQAVFLQGSPSNNKFYVILSGEVAVVIGKKNIGEFGEAEIQAKPRRARKLKRCPQIILTPSVPDVNEMRRLTPTMYDQKRNAGGITLTVTSTKDNERRSPSAGKMSRRSERDQDMLSDRSDRGVERSRSAKKETNRDDLDTKRSPGQDSSRGVKKMRAVVNMVTAVQNMQLNVKAKVDELRVEQGSRRVRGSHVENEEKEKHNESDEEEKKEFEDYATKFGKIVRYFGKGESFGELALKKNAKRSATVLCRTDCEFLILEKQQYDMVFGQVQKEKEEFLRNVFANAMMGSMSSENLNYLAYFFKTINYAKGQYIVKEGTVSPKEARIYVIQRGECVLEKNVTKDMIDPFDKSKVLSSTNEPVNVAVIKAGSIIGEELIETINSYEYSVKAVSDHVLVQAVNRRDCISRFPGDFQEYLSKTYHQKKNYRETTLEKTQAKPTAKEDQYKKEHIYCFRNADMNSLVSKSAAQGLSRHLFRENKIGQSEDQIFQSITLTPLNQDASQKPEGIRTGLSIIENQEKKTPKPSYTRLKSGTVEDERKLLTQDEKLLARFEFLNKLPDKKKEEVVGLQTLKDLKFFPNEKPSHKKSIKHKAQTSRGLDSTMKDSSQNLTKESLDKTKISLTSLNSKYLMTKRNSDDFQHLPSLESVSSPIISSKIIDFHSAGLSNQRGINFNFVTSPYDLTKNSVAHSNIKPISQFMRTSLADKSQWQESSLENLLTSKTDLDKKRDSLELDISKPIETQSTDKENRAHERKHSDSYQLKKAAKNKTLQFMKLSASHLNRRKTEELTPLSGLLTHKPILAPITSPHIKTEGSEMPTIKAIKKSETVSLPNQKKNVGANLRAGTKENLR